MPEDRGVSEEKPKKIGVFLIPYFIIERGKNVMAKDERIKEYTLRDGATKFQFRVYAGIDPMTGKKVKITKKGFDSEKAAYTALIRLELDIQENGIPKKEQKKIFGEVYEVWFENYKNTVKESTWTNTKQYFKNHISEKFDDKIINKIDVLYCQKVVNSWSKKYPKNYKRYKNLVSNVLDYAVSLGYSNDNPMKKISVPRVIEEVSIEKDINFYTKEQLTQFLNEAANILDIKEFTFFRVLAYTGVRKGEAFALTWSDINMTKKTLTINKTVARGDKNKMMVNTPKTKNSNRVISIDDETLNLLTSWKKEQKKYYFKLGINTLNKNQLIFSDYKNRLHDPTVSRLWLRRVYKSSQVNKIATHGFRHTHASLLFEAGATLKEVQERLGHADIQTTANIYTHVTEKKKEETGLKFAKYMKS